MKKLKESKVQGSTELKQLRLVCCMFELMLYALMMGEDDVIDNGLSCRQFIGPIGLSSTVK